MYEKPQGLPQHAFYSSYQFEIFRRPSILSFHSQNEILEDKETSYKEYFIVKRKETITHPFVDLRRFFPFLVSKKLSSWKRDMQGGGSVLLAFLQHLKDNLLFHYCWKNCNALELQPYYWISNEGTGSKVLLLICPDCIYRTSPICFIRKGIRWLCTWDIEIIFTLGLHFYSSELLCHFQTNVCMGNAQGNFHRRKFSLNW